MSSCFLILYDYLMTPRDNAGYNDLFLKTAYEHIDACQYLLSKSELADFEEFFRNIHSLKGSSELMGHIPLAKICEEIISLIRPDGVLLLPNTKLITLLQTLIGKAKNHLNLIQSKKVEELGA